MIFGKTVITQFGKMNKIYIIFLLIFLGCTHTFYRSPLVTHVLAIGVTGDTIKIPINQIQPTKIYNVIGYDSYYPTTYNRDWRFYYDYRDDLRHYNYYPNINNQSLYINPPNANKQSTNAPNPAKDNPKKNN